MPRLHKIREIADLDGSRKHDPQNYPGEVIKNETPVGDPPKHMSAKARKIWRELCANSLPGVMTAADRLSLEVFCVLVAEFREDPKEFPAAKIGHMTKLINRFGMSPADRQQFITLDKDKPKNPFSNLDD